MDTAWFHLLTLQDLSDQGLSASTPFHCQILYLRLTGMQKNASAQD